MVRGAVFLVFAVGATVVHASPCSAAETDQGAEVAAHVGVGTSFSDADVLGPGAGFRLGYATESGAYVGFLGLAHFGTHDEGEPTVRHYSESLRLELGYAIEIFPLDLRPSLRGGMARVTTARDVDGRFWSPDIGLGITFLVRLKGPFVGLDTEARYLARAVDNGDNAYVITTAAVYAVGGYRF